MDPMHILVIDNERSIREECRTIADSLGMQTLTAENAVSAYKVLENHPVDIVVLDIKLPGVNGLEIMRGIKQRKPDAVTVIITAYHSIQTVVQAMREGAFDYVTKPFATEDLKLLLERAMQQVQAASENKMLREKLKSQNGFGGIIGTSPEMERLYRIIAKVAQSSHPVMILGESGTGKELVARTIHFSGPHPEAPFIPVDCGSLVPSMIESELFGYVKGAYPGAARAKDGLLQIASGGTVFLDEVAELPMDLQSKLLRAIQEKEIRPVGGSKRVPIDVRILAASNRDLEQAVSNGTFRKDLYFRLNVVNLRIPPLRERRHDIPLLAGHFLERVNRASLAHKIFSEEALKLMVSYDWPGNVRELENCIERAVALSPGPVLYIADLPSQMQSSVEAKDDKESLHSTIIPISELEKRAIMNALTYVNGDKLRAATLLGIGKTTLYRKLKEYNSYI